MLHKIHWIPQGSISSCCMESTAFNHAAWNPLHSIGMHFTRLHGLHCIQLQCMVSTASMTLHGIHCVQFKYIAPHCMESTAFPRDPLGHAASNPLHSIGIHLTPLHGIHCINRDAFYHAAWNPLHSLTLHGIHCINRDAFYHAAWNPLQSMTMHGIHCINRDAFYHAAWNPLHSMTLHGIYCIHSGSI